MLCNSVCAFFQFSGNKEADGTEHDTQSDSDNDIDKGAVAAAVRIKNYEKDQGNSLNNTYYQRNVVYIIDIQRNDLSFCFPIRFRRLYRAFIKCNVGSRGVLNRVA